MFSKVKSRYISVISVGVGTLLGIGFEHNRKINKDETSYSISANIGSSRFWPVVNAKSHLPVPNQQGIVPVESPNRTLEIMKYGFPGMDNIRSFDDYVLSYDRRNRTPHWVFEHLTSNKVKKTDNVSRENSNFFEDLSIHEYFRALNKDYKGSGFDRGHLAAAGNHKFSQKAMDQTFSLSNISPQVHVLVILRRKCRS